MQSVKLLCNQKIPLVLVLILLAGKALAQVNTQTVKGVVTDKSSEKPLANTTVTVAGTNIHAVSDSLGKYVLNNVPLGRQKIAFSSVGYNPALIPEILITSARQVVLDVALEQNIAALQDVVISSRSRKGTASNEYAGSSARSFSMEEATRYAGGRNDPARLASNFAGVSTTDDSRNDIVVRGNSPSGVLWRMEGVPIPNPNHFAALGTTGGPVSVLNTNALKTSDFYTGAFPAEFGNANAAVFDLSLRSGNKDRFEKTVQLNLFSGLEALLEGPIDKKGGSSFLIGYRYSFAQLAQSAGLNVGTEAVPKYQDITFNFDFKKGKLGKFNLFGLAGSSNIDFIGKDLDSTDLFANQDEDVYVKSRIAVIGLKHTADIGANTYLRTVASYSYTQFEADQYRYDEELVNRRHILEQRNNLGTLRLNSFVNSKISTRFSMRAGVLIERYNTDVYLKERENKPDWVLQRDYNSASLLVQPFAQGRYRFTDKLSLSAGVHGMWYDFNDSKAIEPRASLSYQPGTNKTITLSYGLHSQLQPIPIYLYQERNENGIMDISNRNLGFTKAHHYVAGYDWRFAADWRLKAEVYYQHLFNVPIEQLPTGFSALNAGADFGFPEKAGLVNNGTGYNRGFELTIEKFFSKGFYLLTTASVFNARYKGSDGIERNSTFNNKLVSNFLAGKEFKTGRSGLNAFTIDVKIASSGGRYFTPVDLAASIAQGSEKLDETSYNTERLPNYFRTDVRFGFRINSNKRRVTHTFYLDLQNVTNNENVFTRRYNQVLKTVGTVNQIGFFPDILYRVQF